jgi:hypothetical protein
MSTGLVICSKCKKEVHQDGPHHANGRSEWRHCSRFHGWTPICKGAEPMYPHARVQINGLFCQADGLAPEEPR